MRKSAVFLIYCLLSMGFVLEALAQENGLAFSDSCSPSPLPSSLSLLTPYSEKPTTLFLNFEGAFIFKVSASDAHANFSFLCGGQLPPFDETKFGDLRHFVKRQITGKVAALFSDFNLKVVTRRPSTPPYDMVIISGDASICGYPAGLAGIGPLDCFNQLPGEVAFVFAEMITDLDLLVTVIAHEVGHSYGLLHTTEPCDIMSNFLCPKGAKAFLKLPMTVAPDHQGFCSLERTNSWQMLMDVLGPRRESPDSGTAPTPDALASPDPDGGVTSPPPPSLVLPGNEGCSAAPWNTEHLKDDLELGVFLRVILLHLFFLMLLPLLFTVHRKTCGD